MKTDKQPQVMSLEAMSVEDYKFQNEGNLLEGLLSTPHLCLRSLLQLLAYQSVNELSGVVLWVMWALTQGKVLHMFVLKILYAVHMRRRYLAGFI